MIRGKSEFEERFRTGKVIGYEGLIRQIFGAWNKTPSQNQGNAWLVELSQYPEEQVREAYRLLLNEGVKFMPSLSEFLSRVKQCASKKNKQSYVSKKPLYYPSKAYYLEKFGPANAKAKEALRSKLTPEDYEPKRA